MPAGSPTFLLDKKDAKKYYKEQTPSRIAADPVVAYMSQDQIKKAIKATEQKMKAMADDLNFKEAARLRDELIMLQEKLSSKKKA